MENKYEEKAKKILENAKVVSKLYFYLEAETKEQLERYYKFLIDFIFIQEGVIGVNGKMEEAIIQDGMLTTNAEISIAFEGLADLHKTVFQTNPMHMEIIREKHQESDILEIMFFASKASIFLKEKISEKAKQDQERMKRIRVERNLLGGEELPYVRTKDDFKQ